MKIMKTWMLFLCALSVVAQRSTLHTPPSTLHAPRYSPPMTHEISLAGNFGEPRPNHFHGGLDLRTEGEEGKRVMSIGDGYVSRLTVGLFGFGNAVYVTHPEGYTSVYCHLQRFSPRLERMLKRWQYEHEQREADIRLSPSDYPVSQGQLVAFSGNTGHSFGPHLHLEIHDTRTWDMLDPLEFLGAYVNDSVPPEIHGIKAYPQQGKGVYNEEEHTAWGQVGFAVYADDYMQNSHNHYGIRLTQLLVDGREVFRADVNGIPYSMNRMVNSWGDYDFFFHHSRWWLKMYIEPGNVLPILKADEQRGIINFAEERDYHLEVILTDYFGNQTRKAFVVRGEKSLSTLNAPRSILHAHPSTLHPQRSNFINSPGMQLVVPYGFVGVDTPLDMSVDNSDGLSPVYSFYEHSCPLFYDAELSIAARSQVDDPSKLFIGHDYGQLVSLGGTYKDGWVTTRVRDLGGSFQLLYDDEPPVIEPRSTDASSLLRFDIHDELSGIKSYKGYVDGQFVLFKAMTQSLTVNKTGTTPIACRLSNTPIKKKGVVRHLKLIVTDNCDNQQTYETSITY